MVFNGACALHGAGMGQSNDKLIRSWPKFILSWLKLVQSWCKFVLRWLKLQTLGSQTDIGRLKLRTWTSKMDLGTKSKGAGMHQGCTEDAPGMHQGCTEDAPRMHQGTILTSTWALGHSLFKEDNYRTSNGRSICFDLARSGHKARRIK